MRQHDFDQQETLRRWRRKSVLVAMFWSALLAPVALAEVLLDTRVQKVESDGFGAGVSGVYPGEILRYTIVFSNTGTQTTVAGSIVITNPLPEGGEYVDGSAAGTDSAVTFSVDGENFDVPESLILVEEGAARPASAADYQSIRWTYEPELAAGDSGEVSFDLLIH